MEGWREVKLGDVYSFSSGLSKPRAEFGFGFPFLSFKDVFNNYFVPSVLENLANTNEKERQTCSIKRGDVFLTRTSETPDELGMSSVALSDFSDATFNGFTKRLRPKTNDDILPEFVGYYFRSPKFRAIIGGMSAETTRASLNNDMMKDLVLVLPPLAEQQAISAVLSSLDDKIDLLHRQNKTLEALAQTLFRQWFVEEADKKNERNITEFIEFNPKRELKKGTIAAYIEMSALSTTSFSPSSWYTRKFTSGTKFINGDTLLARITPCLENGKSAFIQCLHDDEIAWGSTEYIVLRPKKILHPLFAYALVKTADFRDHAKSCLAGSSGRQRVELQHLLQYSLTMPTQTKIHRFNECMLSLLPRLVKNANQIHTLTKLRDDLLPKLMSGEVRVHL